MNKEKLLYIHMIEYYWAMRKKEILSFATMWMNLGGIMWCEISQRKTNTAWGHCYIESKKKWTYRNKYQSCGYQRPKAWGKWWDVG